MHIGEIRKALGDDARSPRYLETLHRRGYRFLAHVRVAPLDGAAVALPSGVAPGPAGLEPAATPLADPVGRDAVLEALLEAWLRASAGLRQVVFVSGEPGIGKTTVVDALVGRVRATPTVRVACGQCLERYGARSSVRRPSACCAR